ncbi:kinase/pyrophosphorylase [Pediococcus inopinatus]|uniref:kinase/pyrophosphorylase n=1 Tax=Pediococcus inopinatus TaxID=114090 RepID=UPI00387795F9
MLNQNVNRPKIYYYDVLTPAISLFKQQTGVEAANEPGTVHNLTEGYFDKIAAMEFAVTYDDGKDPTGFLKVILCF